MSSPDNSTFHRKLRLRQREQKDPGDPKQARKSAKRIIKKKGSFLFSTQKRG